MAATGFARKGAIPKATSTAEFKSKSIVKEIANGLNEAKAEEGDESYLALLERNRPLRLFLSSYIITNAGEWFTYVASITMIENLLETAGKSSRTAISILVVVRLVPIIVLSAFGGALADARDRRESMIALDLLGAFVALLYIAAFRANSIALIYIITCIQVCVAGLYEPCRSAIIPLLVTTETELKAATTMATFAWSVMAAVGAALGGLVVAWLGIEMCFILDSFSYLISALVMFRVGGTWSVADATDTQYESVWEQIKGMTIDGAKYVRSSFFGAIVLFKASAAIIYGAGDVLNVSFSERGDHNSNSLRLGILFASVGIGCIVGPLLVDRFTGNQPPNYLQVACIWSFLCIAVGYVGMGLTYRFGYTCLFTAIKSAGSSVVWIDSSLILQSFCAPEMLGRVMALDYALATLTEAISALICGFLQDYVHLTAEAVSLVMAGIGIWMVAIWTAYHCYGHGAAGIMDWSPREGGVDEEVPVIESTPLMNGKHITIHETNGTDIGAIRLYDFANKTN